MAKSKDLKYWSNIFWWRAFCIYIYSWIKVGPHSRPFRHWFWTSSIRNKKIEIIIFFIIFFQIQSFINPMGLTDLPFCRFLILIQTVEFHNFFPLISHQSTSNPIWSVLILFFLLSNLVWNFYFLSIYSFSKLDVTLL